MERGLKAQDILWVWEHGQQSSPPRRALLLWMAARPECDGLALAELPLGQREAGLLRARERTFGPRLEVVVTCPGCQERLEFELNTREERADAPQGPPEAGFELEVEGFRMQLRLPNTADILAIEHLRDAENARRALFARCLESAERGGDRVLAEGIPSALIGQIAQAMHARDPQAESLHPLDCPLCGHHWEAAFEIGDYFWREVEAHARRLLREVDQLARAYGWREDEILGLSALRRRAYLEMTASFGSNAR